MSAKIRPLKFYDDAKMGVVREAFDATVLAWPDTSRREMMGCLVYFRGRKMFAFLVTGGLVIVKIADADRAALATRPGAKPFEMSGRTATRMVQLPASKRADLTPLLPYVRKGYDSCAAPRGSSVLL